MKNKTLKFGLLLLVISMIATYSKAYFTDMKQQQNKIKMGYNEIKIIEEFEQLDHYEINKTYKKKVTINNTGSIPCFVRVFIAASDMKYLSNLNLNSQDWQKIDDYYYYKNQVHPKESTTAILSDVTIANELNLSDFEIYVYCESVQSEGYKNAYEAFQDIN